MIVNGFVKFPREVVERSWFGDAATMTVYVFLLCAAAFRDIEREGYTVRKGQYVTSNRKLAEKCQLSVQQIKTALKHLQATHDITIEPSTKFSIITVNCAVGDDSVNTRVDPRADPQPNPQSNPRSISKEEIKEKYIEEREEGLPARAEDPLIDFSPSSPDGSAEREELVKEYGSSAVCAYEKKFRSWAANKRPNIPMYPTIAKWMAQDIKPAHGGAKHGRAAENSSLDIDEFERAVMKQYKSGRGQNS